MRPSAYKRPLQPTRICFEGGNREAVIVLLSKPSPVLPSGHRLRSAECASAAHAERPFTSTRSSGTKTSAERLASMEKNPTPIAATNGMFLKSAGETKGCGAPFMRQTKPAKATTARNIRVDASSFFRIASSLALIVRLQQLGNRCLLNATCFERAGPPGELVEHRCRLFRYGDHRRTETAALDHGSIDRRILLPHPQIDVCPIVERHLINSFPRT